MVELPRKKPIQKSGTRMYTLVYFRFDALQLAVVLEADRELDEERVHEL